MNQKYSFSEQDLTAYVLGELKGDEAKVIERALRDDPALLAEANEIRRVARVLHDGFHGDQAAPRPLDTARIKQRASVRRAARVDQATHKPRSGMSVVLGGIFAMAACLALVVYQYGAHPWQTEEFGIGTGESPESPKTWEEGPVTWESGATSTGEGAGGAAKGGAAPSETWATAEEGSSRDEVSLGGAPAESKASRSIAMKSATGAAKTPAMPAAAPAKPKADMRGAAAPKPEAVEAPRAKESAKARHRPSTFAPSEPVAQPRSDLLTAGSFDDALNPEIFTRYWAKSPLAQQALPGIGRSPDWKKLPPKLAAGAKKKLELVFVMDATGSMSDELEFLKAEFLAIAREVDLKFPDVEKKFGTMVYRDQGDEYLTRGHKLTADRASVQSFIEQQAAGGGGDYPEAVDVAMNEAVSNFGWSQPDEDTARILFLVADAPPHNEKLSATFSAVSQLREKGVRIFPVASSGVADDAEAVFRGMAALTGGQYVFLTDDSGIGNSHAEPKFPCYHVEKLKPLIVRLISDVVRGERSEPEAQALIRTVGQPRHGVCR